MNVSRFVVSSLVVVVNVGFGSLDVGSIGSGSAATLSIHHLDTVILPNGLVQDGYPVGGLSGIDYTPGAGYVAISDNRGEKGPVRVYALSVPVADGRLKMPTVEAQIDLLDTDGRPYLPRTTDTESVRWLPGGDGFVYTSEGEAKVGRAGFIRTADRGGVYGQDLPIPDAYTPRLGDGGAEVSGIRDNLGFESMTVGYDGSTVVALTENALVQDGSAAGVDSESPARLLVLDRTSGAVIAEYLYPVDRVKPGSLPMATGVSEIVALDDRRYLTLERSLDTATGVFSGKIYRTTVEGADDIAGSVVAPPETRRMSKQLVFDFAAVGVDPQCVEGLTWGPDLPDGRRTLVVVSDDNFGVAGKTAFHLLAVSRG